MTPLPGLLFCEQLFDYGVLTAARWRPADGSQTSEVNEVVQRVDQWARLDAPATAPPLDMSAAHWALSTLAWSVALLVDRGNTGTRLPPELVASEPSGDQACHHWSVDLAFRYLGDVYVRAQAVASEDALVPELAKLISRWPLAAVGTKVSCDEGRGALIMADHCLRRLLRDRIAARRDKDFAPWALVGIDDP